MEDKAMSDVLQFESLNQKISRTTDIFEYQKQKWLRLYGKATQHDYQDATKHLIETRFKKEAETMLGRAPQRLHVQVEDILPTVIFVPLSDLKIVAAELAKK